MMWYTLKLRYICGSREQEKQLLHIMTEGNTCLHALAQLQVCGQF